MKLRSKSRASLVLFALTFLVLILLASSRVYTPTQHSREAVLKTDLRTIRDAIDNYKQDKREPPHSLQDLVDAGYLRSIPVDPITQKADWVLDLEGPVLGDPILRPDLEARRLVGVHSNSDVFSRDGSKYNEW
ncbi:MAG TPA: hypothetical protein VGR55_10830 [Candidatus Acidoferrum sp.]|nr:hypothetical protein [Candidatus Acidoferrum sp.]